MPANKKHLTKSPMQRFAKISAGFAGGYIVTEALHMVLALWLDASGALITLRFGGFILWAVLLIIAFLARNGWKVWLWYLLVTGLLAIAIYFGKVAYPLA